MHTNRDLYELLGLSKEASQDDIQQAHRKLVREYHPDANPGDRSAEERFKEIQRAYEVLSNEEKRREYDQGLHTSPRASPSRPRQRRAGGGIAYGSSERARGNRGLLFSLGYLLGIALVVLVLALLVMLVLGLD